MFGAFVPADYVREAIPRWLQPLNHLLYLLFVGFYLLTAYRDPGIISRTDHMLAPEYTEEDSAHQIAAAELSESKHAEGPEESSSKPPGEATPSDSEDEVKGEATIYRARECSTCMIERPPLASHCAHCNNCVRDFDQ